MSWAAVDQRTDVYGAAVVLWEVLVGSPVFRSDSEGGIVGKVLEGNVVRPGALVPRIPAALDAIVMRGLAARPQDRFASALDMAVALEAVFASKPVDSTELAAWLQGLGAETLREQARLPADLRRRSPPLRKLASRPTPVIAPPVPAGPAMALPAFQKELVIRAAIFVFAIACGALAEVAVARAIHGPPEMSAESSR